MRWTVEFICVQKIFDKGTLQREEKYYVKGKQTIWFVLFCLFYFVKDSILKALSHFPFYFDAFHAVLILCTRILPHAMLCERQTP